MNHYISQLIEKGLVQACKNCGETGGLRAVLTRDDPQNYAAIVCDNCPDPHGKFDGQRFVQWGKRPENFGTRPSKSGGKKLLDEILKDRGIRTLYCEICLRYEYALGPNERIEAHHVIEYQDSRNNEVSNLRPYCTRCHTLVHHERTYSIGEQAGKAEPFTDEPSRELTTSAPF